LPSFDILRITMASMSGFTTTPTSTDPR
jgi:hypothetical protein